MRALILNGSPESCDTADAVLSILRDDLGKREWEIREFVLREERIAYCTGCFGCWLKTPGECVMDDAGREIARSIVQCDLVIYLTPVTFGGYSSDLKKALDRMIPVISPFFINVDGETHHKKRYDHYPSMLAVGILPKSDDESARLFEALHSRNAINAHAPASAAGTVVSGWSTEEVRIIVESLLSKTGVIR